MARKKQKGVDFTPEKLTKYFFRAYSWWACLILICIIGFVVEFFTWFFNGPRFLGLAFVIPALLGLLLTKPLACLFGKNQFRWKYSGMLSLVSEGICALLLVLSAFSELLFAFVLGAGFILFVRLFVLCGVVNHRTSKMLPAALVQPLAAVLCGIWFFGIPGLVCGLISLFIFGGSMTLFLWLFDLPLKKAFGITGMGFANVYFDQMLYGRNDMESYLEKITEKAIVPETTFFFTRENKKDIWFVVPNLHPGPLADIGGSNFPKILHDELAEHAEVVVSHGSASHDMNLISNDETAKIRDAILQSLDGVTYCEEASLPQRTKFGSVSILSQKFGNSLLMVTTRSPEMTEDLDYPLGRIIMGEARHLYDNIGLVDAHNCMPQTTHVIYPGTQEGTEFILGARESMEKIKAAPLWPFKAGVANRKLPYDRSDGFGELGLSVFVTEVKNRKTAYIVFDGNNVEAGVREVLRDAVLEIVDEAEILTTDTHVVNSMTSRNPVGMVIPAEEILTHVMAALQEALSDMAPAKAGAATGICRDVKVFGPGKFARISSCVTGLVTTMVPYIITFLIISILVTFIGCAVFS
ncbi:MAG TPA: DUF2070 family protein [Methanocorpusculum sp.]|nr:DUF2070 family protein [Methanocorpusculum sp.]